MSVRRFIAPEIWRRDWFLALSSEQRIAFIWAFTNDAVNACGVYRPGFTAAASTLGFDVEKAVEAISAQSRRLIYFKDEGLLWVVNFLRYQSCAGKFTQGAVRRLVEITDAPHIVGPWLMANRMTVRQYGPAVKEAKEAGWLVNASSVAFTLDGSVEESWQIPRGSGPDDYIMACSNGSPSIQAALIDPPDPAKKEPAGWPGELSREDALEVFDFWKRLFDKDGRTKFTADREQKIRARGREGVTRAEALLAVLGMWKRAKSEPLPNGKSRFEEPDAHAFSLIFRNDEKMRGNIDKAAQVLRRKQWSISPDGRSIVDKDGKEVPIVAGSKAGK